MGFGDSLRGPFEALRLEEYFCLFMLKLRRIELLGFKSFYERSEITVSDIGVTAVVGPNGCGKSNISDAIAWVLGEQRARSLRGGRMEDVIFSGTDRRSPLGMAEVTISLVDDAPAHSNGGPPPGPFEMTVQRRLFRSGESQYLLNGRPCLLRDIQDLFLGTGLGPNSYAIIEQGRIGQLLSARPSDRRTVIEEAAGVTKFKAKRKLAESRLQAARNNLSRVNDILAEVERQRNSLKRQAGKARRYRQVRRRMREVLGAVFSTRAEMLIDGQERVDRGLAGISSEGERMEAKVAELDAQVHRSREGVETEEKRLDETREVQVAAKLDLEKAHQRIERFEDQVRSLDERIRELIAEKDRVTEDLKTRQEEVAASVSRFGEADQGLAEARTKHQSAQASLEATGRLRSEAEAAIDGLRNRRFDIVSREAEIGNELSGKADLVQRLDRQVDRVKVEEEEALLAAQECRAKLEAAQLEHSSRQTEISRLALERDRVETEFREVTSGYGVAQEAAAEARSSEEGIRHRLETIRELSLDRAYGTESVQQFFNHVRDESWAPMGIVADFVEVEPDYEAIVEDLFHSELQYVVVEDLLHAEKALAIARGATHGRLEFLVADPSPETSGEAEAIQDATPVVDLVRLDPRLQFFRSHVRNTYIVEDLSLAWRLSGSYRGKTFVARSGEVVRDRVISWGERSSHGPLSLKRELRDLDRRVEEARRESHTASKRAEELGERLERLAQSRQELSIKLQEAEKEALGLDHGLRSLTAELERTGQRLGTAQAEIHRFAEERKDLEDALVRARADLETVRAEKAGIDGELEVHGAERERLRSDLETQSLAAAELRSQLAVLEERKETLARDIAALRAQAVELEARCRQVEEQIEGTRAQKSTALASIEADQLRQEELGVRVEELQDQISKVIEGLETFRRKLHEAEMGWDEARAALDGWKDRHNQLEIEKTQIDADLNHLVSLCFSELGESIESVCLDTFETLGPEQLEERDSEYQDLRGKIDSIGAVNMMAVEEYEEAAQRFEFLTGQRQDLLDSIRDTALAIEEIDTVCRQQFGEAFNLINQGFTQAFGELFGGGHGELRLVGQEGDSSDAGIEIVAQPPGKKLQNVLLLSGGEKALTALSLVVALFRFKPSPFCVLDEVDAPLDDVNIDRFANLIRVMSDETQFIVITHSKRTMEMANQLYGVTMEEPGISKVVSVRLN